MKKWLIILSLLLFIAALIAITKSSLAPTSAATVNSYLPSPGHIKLYFCPRDNCEQVLVDFINSAQFSLHCAFYDIGLEPVQKTLLEKSKQSSTIDVNSTDVNSKIDVRIVTDNDYLHKFNHSFVKADKWGLMHNKFCIVDGKAVSTGSMNPTNNDAHKNNNNLLLITSSLVAQNYEDEFQELWRGEFKKGEQIKNPQIIVGEFAEGILSSQAIPLEIYFCPEDSCADHVKEELNKAKKSIRFMIFSFTHNGIANILLLKHLENISIQGIMETRQISEHSKFEVLQYQLGSEAVIKDSNPHNLHHKVFIIDGETVITGSFNPTAGGDERNDENLIIIRDRGIAGRFGEEFEQLFSGNNLINSAQSSE